jgi:crotonobetainyl-CoA:carnitine CoA-transferase CaiB-like acyl-CoA transferase
VSVDEGHVLSGLRVVEYGDFVSAPYCAKLLADLGAEVLKIEPPRGDTARQRGPFPGDRPHPERSGLFLYLNTNKRGVTLDVSTATGRAILDRLLADADIFVHNQPPAALPGLGLDYPTLAAKHPRLIVTAISPFGQTGPYRDYKAYDITTAAAGGLSLGIGDPQRAPLKLPLTQSGIQAGLAAAIASLAAVFARDATGRGQAIDVAEADVWATFHTGVGVVAWVFSGRVRKRSGHRLLGLPYPHTVLPCKDGYVALQASERRQWERFIEMIGSPEWAKSPRYQNRLANNEQYADELDALLAPWLMARTKDEIFAICREYKIAGAPLKTVEEVVHDEQLRERDFFVQIDSPETGPLTYPGLPFTFSEVPWKRSRRAPRLGEHNDAVYAEQLGYTPRQLTELRQVGVI